jgi:molecular chaperone GrpE
LGYGAPVSEQEDQPVAESPSPVEAVAPPVELTAEQRIAVLEKEKVDLRERMLRVAADFENWKKRSKKDLTDAEWNAKKDVLKDFLDVVDGLERATAASGDVPQAQPVLDGVRLVLRLFQNKFERHGVTAVESKGQPFDPRLHEAVARVPTADAPVGQIIDELVRGYRMGDRLLRPAVVSVAAAPPAPAADPAPSNDGNG